MPRLSVKQRRAVISSVDEEADGTWICEVCGEHEEWEGLAIYEIERNTRAVPEPRAVCLCVICADRVPHGKVLNV